MDKLSDDEKFEQIEEILEQRKRKGVLEYLVRWRGEENAETWEPAKMILADSAAAVAHFTEKMKAAAKPKRSSSRSRKDSRSRSRSSSRSRKSQSSTSVSKRQTRSRSGSRSRGRGQKSDSDLKKEVAADESANQSIASKSSSQSSVQSVNKSFEEANNSEKKADAAEAMPTDSTQRVLRSSTVQKRKELEVQRVHNEQRPTRDDDGKPRSVIWKVADYSVIVLFVLSLLVALFLFMEKFVDMEGFKNQAFPSLTLLKKRLVSAQNGLLNAGQAGFDFVSDNFLYLVEQIKGADSAGPAQTQSAPQSGAGRVPKQA